MAPKIYAALIIIGIILFLYASWRSGKRGAIREKERLANLSNLAKVIQEAWTKEELQVALELYNTTKIDERSTDEQIQLWYSFGILKGKGEMFLHQQGK